MLAKLETCVQANCPDAEELAVAAFFAEEGSVEAVAEWRRKLGRQEFRTVP
jgi:hypothetical protein